MSEIKNVFSNKMCTFNVHLILYFESSFSAVLFINLIKTQSNRFNIFFPPIRSWYLISGSIQCATTWQLNTASECKVELFCFLNCSLMQTMTFVIRDIDVNMVSSPATCIDNRRNSALNVNDI